jgi:Ohr subfamily peroxiredoxin
VKTLYTTTVKVTGGRDGRAQSSDGELTLELTTPKELGGPGGPGTNPEQLFAAGYAACFESALRHVAGQQGLNVDNASVTGTVGIGPNTNGGFALAVKLDVSLPDVPPDQAQHLANTVHTQVCPYSNAIRGNVDVELAVN